MSERKCVFCGCSLPDNAKFCPACGKMQSYKKQYCIYCGHLIQFDSDDKTIICPNCGESNDVLPESLQEKNDRNQLETIDSNNDEQIDLDQDIDDGNGNDNNSIIPNGCKGSAKEQMEKPDIENSEIVWSCSYCGAKNSQNENFCIRCGTSPEGNIWKCPSCSHINSTKVEECRLCGKSHKIFISHDNVPESKTTQHINEITNAAQKLDTNEKALVLNANNSWTCSQCGTDNNQDDRHCKKCGQSRYQKLIWECPSCKSLNTAADSQCRKCGELRNCQKQQSSPDLSLNTNGWICSYCNAVNDEKDSFCKTCGISKHRQNWECKICGTINAMSSSYCSFCNSKNTHIIRVPSMLNSNNDYSSTHSSISNNAEDGFGKKKADDITEIKTNDTKSPEPKSNKVSSIIMILFWSFLIYWGPVRYGYLSHQAIEVYRGIFISMIVFLLCRKKLNSFWTFVWSFLSCFIAMWPLLPFIGLVKIYDDIMKIFIK